MSVCFYGPSAAWLGRFPLGQARGTVPFAGTSSFAVSDVLCPLAVPVPRGAADTMFSWHGMVGRDQPSSFCPPLLCRDGCYHYTGILCWDRLHCSSFPIGSKQLVYFPLQSTVTVGSSVASPGGRGTAVLRSCSGDTRAAPLGRGCLRGS